MDCKRTRELLSEYLDDALSVDVKVRLEDHLAGCPACAEDLESLRRVVAGVRGLGKVAAPEDFLGGVMSGIERAIAAPPRAAGFRWIYPLATAAAFLAAVTVIFFIIEGERAVTGLTPDLVADLDGDVLLDKEKAPQATVDGFVAGGKAKSLRRLGREDSREGMQASRGRSLGLDEIGEPGREHEEGEESGAEAGAGGAIPVKGEIDAAVEIDKSRERLKKTAPRRPESESKGKRVQAPGDLRGTSNGTEASASGTAASAAPAAGDAAGAAPAEKLHADYNVLVVETDRDWNDQAETLNASRVPLKADASELNAGYGRKAAGQDPQIALYEINVSDIDGLVRGLADFGAAAIHAYAVPDKDAIVAESILIQSSTADEIADEKARAPVTLWSRNKLQKESLERLGALGYSAGRDELSGIVRDTLAAIDREKRDAAETRSDDVPGARGVRDGTTRANARRKGAFEGDRDRVQDEPAVPPRKILILFVKKARTPATKPR
jgi:hypothetical protein